MINAIYDGFDNATVQTCATCHDRTGSLYNSEFANSHLVKNHADNIATTPLCATTCHNGADMVVDVHNNNCVDCHTNTTNDGTLHDGTTGTSFGGITSYGTTVGHTFGGSSTCANCHGAYFDSHTHSHTMSTVALCLNCHAGATGAPYIGGADAHVTLGCATCHDTGTDGTLQGSATGAVGGENCQGCHTGYFDNHGHNHAASVTAPVAPATFTQDCLTSGCHVATTTPFDTEVHSPAACFTCHDSGTGALRSGTKGDATGATGECANCHAAWFDGHQTHTATTHAVEQDSAGGGQDLSNGALCNSCHGVGGTSNATKFTNAWDDGSINDIFALHTGTCTLCHDSTRTNVSDPGTIRTWASVAEVIQNAAPAKCLDCHFDRAASHGGHSATDWDYSAVVDDCVDCHADGGNGTVLGVHNDTCTLCHFDPGGGDYTRIVGLGGDGDASGMVGRVGTCLDCHPSGTYSKTSIHHDTANAIALPTSNCTTACHNTTTGHNGDHSSLVTDALLCANCHTTTAPVGADNVPVDATAGNLVHDYCTSCHTNPSNDLIDTITPPSANGYVPTTMNNADGTTLTNNGGGACDACHTTYYDAHTHGHTMNTVALCLNCHTATAAPYETGGQVHAASSCSTCHNAGTGALQGSAVGATGGEDCQACHTGYFDSHQHGVAGAPEHTMGTVALCLNCHTATTVPYTGVGQVHNASTCTTCHSAVTGALTGSAVGATGGENCQGCHTTYFNGHGHDHTASVATPADTSTYTKDCLTCHTATSDPFIGGSEVHNPSSCTTCHDAGTGALRSGAKGDATGANGECANCHNAWFDGHTYDASHTVGINGDTSGGQTCSTAGCHDGQSENWTNIKTRHDLANGGASVCLVCHDSTRNDADGDVQTIIQNSSVSTSCLECHASKSSGHGGHDINDGKIDNNNNCTTGGCHGGGTAHPYVIHDVADATVNPGGSNDCSICHVGKPGGGGPMHDYLELSGELNLPGGGDCTQCHEMTAANQTTRISDHHTYTTIASLKVDPGSAMSGNCVFCHQPDVGQNGVAGHEARADLQMPPNLACNYCHLWWPNEAYTGTPVNIYSLDWNPNTNPNVDAGSAPLSTHAVSTAAIPISDYAACFACHGKTSYNGTAGNSTQVVPFHGYGVDGNEVYTGDSTCFGAGPCGGQADDLINIYGSPTITGFDHGLDHLTDKGRHPGFNSLNMLEPYLSLVPSGANPGKGDVYDGQSTGKKAHQADAGAYETPALTGTTTFNIPWDNYAPAFPTAAGSVSIDTEYDHVNHTDTTETHTVPTVMRTVPLDGSW